MVPQGPDAGLQAPLPPSHIRPLPPGLEGPQGPLRSSTSGLLPLSAAPLMVVPGPNLSSPGTSTPAPLVAGHSSLRSSFCLRTPTPPSRGWRLEPAGEGEGEGEQPQVRP